MAHSYLVFDFGTDEAAAQQARHKVEGWKQAFRLGNKILMKFERQEPPETDGGKSKKKEPEAGAADRIRILIRLDFSDHEKLSHHRWLERIPNEEPFKNAKGEVVRQGEAAFAKTADLFDSLA
jgi:hypothetical protein